MKGNELLTTSEAAELASVGASTIKRWADQGILPFVRTVGGHRRFERGAVERALWSLQPTGGALEVPSHATQPLALSPAAPPPHALHGLGAQQAPHDGCPEDRAIEWYATLARARRHELDGQLLEARARLGRWSAVADEVASGLRELGRAWERGDLSIAEEHVASEQLARALARVGDTLPTPLGGPRVLLACVPSDEHTLGLSLAELCTREAGAVSVWLGRHTPVSELLRVLATDGACVVVLAASSVCRDAVALTRIADEVGAACRRAGAALVLGGSGAWPERHVRATRVTAYQEYQVLLAREVAGARESAR